MTLRRYAPMKPSRGTVIAKKVRDAVMRRDGYCVGMRVDMPDPCIGQLELDHVRASGGMGMKSESTERNLVLICAWHHRVKTLNGRKWRPVLLAYIESKAAA